MSSKLHPGQIAGEMLSYNAQAQAKATQTLAETMRRLKNLNLDDSDYLAAGAKLIETQGIMNDKGELQRWVAPPVQQQQAYRAPKSAGMRPAMTGNWEPRLVVKELSNGKTKEVWQVRGQGSEKYDFDFRHEVVAATVAAALNETNNKFDGRILRIKQLCEQETAILVEMRKTKTLLESGSKTAATDLKGLKAELDKVRRVLGVKG